MSSADSVIISHKLLSEQELSFCKELVSKIPIHGAFLGVIKSADERLNPVILASNELVYIKLTSITLNEDQVLINYLDATNKQLKKHRLANQELQSGNLDNLFWQSRSYEQMTLGSHIKAHKLTTEQANQFLLKILNQLLELRRYNITHGHISPENIIIEDQGIRFVDFNFSFCLDKSHGSKFLPPESNVALTPDFRSDIFCFGKIIKYLYKGLQCPLPLDLPDRMCSIEPKDRPDILEVNNTITSTFTKKRSKTAMWSAPSTPASEVNPAVRFQKYLTPDMIALIRKEHTEHQKAVKKATKSFFTQAHLFIGFFTAILLWAAYLAYPYLQRPAEELPVVVQEIKEPEVPSVRYAKNILRKANIKDYEEAAKILALASKDLTQLDFIEKYFLSSDTQDIQLAKVKALLPIFGSNTMALDKLYPELKKNNVLPAYFQWFQRNELAEWGKIPASTKLFIFGASIPNGLLGLEMYLDLSRHLDPTIAQSGIKGMQELISNQFDAEFYQQLLLEAPSFARSQVTFLVFALKKEGAVSSALTSEWFKNTKPSPDVVLRLALKKSKERKKEDYFSFYAARYLKNRDLKLTPDQSRQLKNHHEMQLTLLGK